MIDTVIDYRIWKMKGKSAKCIEWLQGHECRLEGGGVNRRLIFYDYGLTNAE
jgi:hypothetical protein